MNATGTDDANRAYYDAFSKGYEDQRGANAPDGYHELLDELETGFVRRYGRGANILEVGCGTGLVMRRISEFARSTQGVDISPGMLEKARTRGLNVQEGSATKLPFEDNSFDLTCSFKVLAHVPEIGTALSEMARVTRRGGIVLAEFYNPHSLRGLVKRFGRAGAISDEKNESDVYTRFDSPAEIERIMPSNCELVDARGVRIFVPTAHTMNLPVVRSIFRWAERKSCDSRLSRFGGFYIAAMRKL
ncbi:MAG: methyltransferase domain-containing protein [Polyangiaceae bacterium]|nr:methyltransferase domain-containing protein [Polyangiaceae bacterium]